MDFCTTIPVSWRCLGTQASLKLFRLFQFYLRCNTCSKLGQSSESTQKLGDKHRASKRSPRGPGQGTSSVYYGCYHQHPKGSSLKIQQIPSCSGPMDFCLTLPNCVIQSSPSCLHRSAPATQASLLSFRDAEHTQALGHGNR